MGDGQGARRERRRLMSLMLDAVWCGIVTEAVLEAAGDGACQDDIAAAIERANA